MKARKSFHPKKNLTPATEPFYLWLRFHEAFNRTIKTTVASLFFTEEALSKMENPSPKLAELIAQSGEPWGTKSHYDVGAELDAANQMICQGSVVRVWSAFDHLLTGLEADLDSWTDHEKAKPQIHDDASEETDSNGESRLIKINSKRKLLDNTYSNHLLVDEYFKRLRNCICHRNGEASDHLIEHSESAPFIKAWNEVNVSPRKRANPELPTIRKGRVMMSPRHAVFYSANCHCLAKAINRAYYNLLGIEGYIFRAARFAVEDYAGSKITKNPEGLINVYLRKRHCYYFSDEPRDVIAVMKKTGVWTEYRKQYEQLAQLMKSSSW